MDVNSRDPSQNIIPFRIKGVEVGRFDICGNLGIGTTAPTANLDVVGNVKINGELYVNGNPLTSLTSGVVVNMDSQPVAATALNRQKKQSIPIAAGSTLATSDVIAKMSGVSVGKTQTYGVGPAQMASYGNIVVAVGSGTNSIAYSLVNPPTASSWVGIPNSAATFTTQGWNIAYANGTWVAVGEGTNAIAYSTTTPPVASSWVGIPTGTSLNGVVNTFGTRGFDIAYGNGAWVAVGFGTNSISYSLANPPTAESWVAIPVSFSPTIFGNGGYGITFGNGTWVAAGLGTNVIAYSTRTPPTADSWVVVPFSNVNDAGVNNTYTTFGINVIYANGVWLAAGTGTNTLCYSVENPPIAGSWMPITTGVLFGTTGRSLAYGNGTWVACGESGSLLAYSTSRIPHSSSWVSMKGPTPSSSGEQINNVTFNAATNTWYFTGDIGTNCMFYSTATPPVPATWIGVPRNASTFTTQAFGAVGITTPAFTSPVNVARLDNKVTFPANRMLAVGGGGADVLARSANTPTPAMTSTISYSDDDGVTWQMVPGGATNAMFSSAADISAGTSFGVGGSRGANAVAWNGEKWVAAGNGRTHSLAFSDDGGITWSGITGKSIFSVEARDVAWNGQMWVAVGRGINFSTAYSYDGVTWMGPVTDDVSGTPINVFSLDIAGPNAAMSDISGGGNQVVWTGKMWVATGTRTLIPGSSPAAYYTVAYSLDGKSWTGVPESGATSTGFDIYAHGVAWNGRNFVATGRGTVNTLAYFTDASVTTTPSTWQGLGNSVFSIWGRGVTWGARRWMATGRGTNTVAYSTNGRNWQGCGANVFKPLRRFMAMGDTGLYTTVSSGQPQRGVAFTYSDDGVTWDAPVVNQAVEFSTPVGGRSDTTRSVVFTNNTLITNVITDNSGQHTALMYSTDAGASWARVPGSSDTEANGGTGMTPANNGAYSLAMNPTRTRFLVGGGDTGSATRKVYFSNDGFNWRNSVSSPNSTQMAWVWASLWVGGGYNRWLIGGSDATTNANGRIMYSGDADAVAAWLPVSPATYAGTIVSCFAANTDFSVILAGATSGNVIYRSVNGGANWTTVSISGTPTGSVRSIAFSPALGRWVAVGGGSGAANTIIYSTDATGTAWLAPPLQAKAAATAIFRNGSEATRVIWDAVGGRFLVGGWNGASTDTLTNVFGLDLSNNNPGYTMAYSSDGVNWTPVTVRSSDDTGASGGTVFGPFLTQCREIMALDVSGDFTPINTGYSVTWNSYSNRFVATGNGTTPVVYSSDGGVTWTPANQQSPQQAIAVAGGLSGTSGSTTTGSPITYTIDGKIWSQAIGAKEAFGSSGTVLAVRYGQTSPAISPNGRIWVAGGTSGSGISNLAFSQNGIRWTPIANATTMITNVRAIAYAPSDQVAGGNAAITATSGVGNGVWVAGGDTTNSLIFSYDGISWSEVPNSLTILNRCNAIAFGSSTGAGVFVAGGLAGTLDPTANMAYSTDGLNWQPIRGSGSRISTGGGQSINCITYGRDENGRGLWVAGAFGSSTVSILYSYNGIDWIGVVNSGVSLSSTITGLAYGVNSTTGRGLWVASVYRQTSDRYSFLFSANGRDGWTSVLNTKAGLFELNTSGATNVAYLNGVWYATGLSAGLGSTGGRTLAYSYEGSSGWFGVYPTTNLYGVAVPTYSTTDMRCVATTGDFVIPMGAGAALTPVRSLGWTAGVGSAYLQHPTILFGSTSAASAAAAAAMSTDGGRSWGASTLSIARSAFRGGDCNDAFWNGIVWAAVGYDAVSGAKVATSKDGVTWTQIPAGSIPIAGVLYSIMWNGSVWMVGGDGSPTNDANTASIAWSPDLAIWTGIANTDTKLRVVKRIAWNGMYWTAAGIGDVSTIMHSMDKNGLKWEDTYMSDENTNKTANVMSSGNDVVWGGGRWVAVGRPNSSGGSAAASILYSVDTPAVEGAADPEYAIKGRRWTGVAGSAQLFPYGANSVSWNGKRFIATGPASSAASTGNIIAWSADGITWTAYSTAKTVAPGQRWVAVGSGSRACIALSADGRVWTDVSGSAVLFPDISGASATLVSSMKTGARAIGWNGNSLVVGGARAATTVTASSTTSAATMATTGRTTIPVCAFIGSGNGVMGGGTTNIPDASFQTLTMRASSSVFITHLDVNIRESSAPWANMWLNTYTDLSGTQLFQVTPETQTFSSALKWNGWSWVANFGMTTFNPQTGEQYGSLWYCTDPLARVGWSVASNSAAPRILIGQGGYAALEWNGVAWLACGYDPNNNNLIYTTDRYGATGWTTVSGIVNAGGSGGGSASFQPVCIAASPRFWVVGGSQVGAGSAIYYTSDRTGATGWRAVTTTGVGASVLPAIRITSIGYNGTAWICCGGGRVGTDSSGGVFSSGSISWRADPTGTNASNDFATGWAAATVSGTSGGIPPIMSASSAIATNVGAGVTTPIWVVVGEDLPGNSGGQIAYTTTLNGSSEWKRPATGTLTNPTFGRLNGIAWTGYSWIVTSGAGFSRLASTTDPTAATQWNNTTNGLFTPTLCTNAVAFANIPISLLTTGMPTSAGVGAGTGAMWRGGVGRAQGLLPGGGADTTSVVVRSGNGAEGTSWSQTYSRNFLIAVGGGVIRDSNNGGGLNRMAFSYDGGLSWTTNNTSVLTTAANATFGTVRTVKYGNGMWVAGGDSAGSSSSGGNCLAWSRDGVNWTGAGGTQIFGSAGACYAVCCNDRGRWVAVGGAALGTAGTYTNTSGAIYTMAWSDDGMNWTPILGSRALFGIVCQGVTYGADASGVGMWTAIGRGATYTGCAYSYDGKTWYLSQTSGSLFGTGANVLTERYAPVASASWLAISMSSSGQYQTAGINGGIIWTSSDFGVTWTSRNITGQWRSVSLSSTGQYQTACSFTGKIWTSSDYGVNWRERDSDRNWNCVSVSSTGQYQSAVVSVGLIYTSSDYGVTWNVVTQVASVPPSADWRSISVSSTGQYQTACVFNGQIYTSSNYGINWTVRDSSRSWQSISISSTGQYQTAAVYNNNNNGYIFNSSNYGVDWLLSGSVTDAWRFWRSTSVSSTGQYQTAVVEGGNLWTSSNYGVSWTPRDSGRNWLSVSLSSTGQYQTAVVSGGLIFISSNFGETWSSAATDSRSLGIAYGKDASGVGMWVATAGRRDRDVSANIANTMAYSYDGKLWRGIRASAGLSEQAWSVAYGKDGFGVGMWVAAGYDTTCGLKWSYDGVTWNASTGASGAAVWAGMAAGRRALCVYWNGSMWLASTSDTRNGEPRGTTMAANNASSVPGYLLYSYNGKNWLPVLAPNTYAATNTGSAQTSVYSVLPNPVILDFGSFYDDQAQRGVTIANTTARTVGAVMSGGVPIENVNTIVPYGKGSLTTGQVPFLMGGDSGLVDSVPGTPPITSELAAATTSLSTSTDGGITWRAVPNSTRVMTKVNKILCDETTQQIVAVGTGNYSVATSTPATAASADGWVGVFGSRMTDTRAGLFEKYGTGASWFGGAKMWIASGRAQSRRGSSLAVSVNGTVWQDAKIVSQVAAGTALGGRGGGLTSRTTNTTTTPISFNSALIPYTAPATPLLTYTDSAAAFSTQVSSVATNSQYNRAVVGGSGIQFVAGGRGGSGIAVSNDGQNWTAAAAASGAATVFQTPTNVAAYSTAAGSGGFDASFGTVALTQRLTTPATYPSGSLGSVSVSKTGQYQSAVIYGGNIWTSSDYGVTWTERTTGANRNWNCISLSSSGQYQTATAYTSGNIWTSSDYGVTWTSRATALNWISVSLSSTGQYQTAVVQFGKIWTSSDYGVNWVDRATSLNWRSVSLSSTGQYQSACGISSGNIWTSSDYGVTWTSRAGALEWYSISISSTGQYQSAAAYGNNIWTSLDYGINWTPRATTGLNWIAISLSSSGQYQTSAVNSGFIYTSSDFGVTWTRRNVPGTTDGSTISLSSTGQYQTALPSGSSIYTSSDFGVTWVQRSTNTRTNAFTRIKSSASGQYQLATSGPVGNTNGQLYVSSDYGQTWIPRRGLATWLGGAVSATGGLMMTMAPGAPTIIKLNNALSYSPILYLDATNSNSYNVSTNTWTNLGSLGGNVVMTNMGSFDAADNGGSFNFNGASNYGRLTTSSTSFSNVTFIAVVNLANIAPAQWRLIISLENWSPSVSVYNNSLYFYSSSPSSFNTSSPVSFVTNTWYFVASTYNSSTGVTTFYVNGIAIGTVNGTSGASWSGTRFSIGADIVNTYPWNGKISSLAVYNRVLTASEIYNLYFSSTILRSTDYGNTFNEITGTALTSPAYWRSIAITNSGATQTALAYGSSIYRSADYGSTWNSTAAVDVVGIFTTEFSSVVSPTYAWKSIAMSSDARYQTGVVSGSGRIYVNSNYGREAWTEVESPRNWAFVAMSADGKYQSAVVTSGAIYYNSTFGTGTWTAVTSPTGLTWTGIAVSSADGKYQTAVASGPENIRVNSNFGVGTWVSKEVARNWSGVAISSTGRYQTAIHNNGFIYIDASFGEAATWTSVLTDTPRAWASVAMSGSGQYQTAVVSGGKIYANNNYGASGAWVETEMNRAWISVAVSSATGRYQTAVVQNGQIYTNATFGLGAWTAVDSSRNWVSVAVSSDGKYQSAVVATSGQVYFSRNFGSTWSTTAGLDIMGNQWQDVAVSAETGAVQVTCVSGGYLYVSSDTGANWASTTVNIDGAGPQTTNRTWQAVAVSADGQYGLACVNSTTASGYLYRSTDSGATWVSSSVVIDGVTPQTTNRPWQDVGMSANGKYQVACLNNISQTSFTSTIASAASVMVAPPGALETTYGGAWARLGTTDISGVDVNEYSGRSVILSADGTTVAVGAYNNNSGRGVTRIYKLTGNVWTRLGTTDISGVDAGEYSGYSVSLSADGTTVAVGAPGNNGGRGVTRIYKLTGNVWTRLGATDISGVDVGEQSGWSVSLSADGTTVAVGAYNNNGSRGVTRIYKLTGNVWTRLGTTDISGVDAGEQSGWSVSLSADGTTVAIGANLNNSNRGVTRIYKLTENVWTRLGTTDISGVDAGEFSGSSVSLSADGTTVAVGAYLNNSGRGVTRIYKLTGNVWTRLGTTDISGVDAGEQSGWSVSLSADGTTVAIGANLNNSNRGVTRIYKLTENVWTRLGTTDISGVDAGEFSGSSVSLSADGTTVAVGAYLNNSGRGVTRIYRIPVTNAITYTSSSSSVADICGNLLLIKGTNGTSNIVATQGATTTNGTLTVSGTTYTLVYTLGSVSTTSFIYYSKNYGANWTSLTAAGSRAWSSVALSENGSTISATTSDASGGVWVYAMPDDRYYRSPALTNVGSTTTPATVRAIAYGNSGTGAALDGYWVAGADASANSLAYSSNGSDWTAVVGSKTTLFNSVNGVAYGADTSGTPLWVAVGAPFIGSLPGSTAYSIAYSYNMTTWVGVRNAANFTGQGNHVAYGQDEFGAGVWVAVGQADGVLATNLGNSSLYNSNGTAGTTIFYSYDGANWAAATGLGIFAVAGTDVTWGVDASGVGTWVATGIGFTDPLTGVVLTGGQVAHSTNGRVWTPIRAITAIVPAMAPTTLASRGSVIPPPPASSGVLAPVYGNVWNQLGSEILGTQQYEQNGISVSVSADGTTVAIGSYLYDVTGSNNEGRTRIYKYNTGTSSWGQLGMDISGTQRDEYSGASVSLSADGTVVAIGSYAYDKAGGTTNANTDEGRTRVYKYNGISWGQMGLDISGTQVNEQSGWSVSLSADGTTVAVGSYLYDITGTNAEGRTRVYKYNTGTSSWTQLGLDISGTQLTERSGYSVSLSADGTTVAVGSYIYDTNNADVGRTRVYKYNTGTSSWVQLGLDISGTQLFEYSGASVSLSADGTTVAIGSYWYDKAGGTTDAGTEEGRTRVYKYNTGTSSWGQLGSDIMGTQANENSGWSVSLSADGTMVAVGSRYYDVTGTNNEGRTRIYKYIGTTWTQLGSDIMGTQTNEFSGYSVSLSADGTTVAVGHYLYDKTGGTTDVSTSEGRVRIYKIDTFGNVTYSISNPAIADIYANTILSIKEGVSGTATITAVQAATPPYTATPVTVQGTLTVTGNVYTLVYNNVITTFTPFTTSALTVAYGRAGSQGTGAPLWMVGGAGGNVFAMSSAPTTTGAWSVVESANAPFPTCNSIGYSNGVWVAGNNTDAANILARSVDGGSTWTPVTASSVSGILTGAAALGANAFCNYSLAYADYSNDTNLRSWIAVQGTKNFFFEGGVSAVATVTPDVSAGLYNIGGTRAWWVAGGVGLAGVASIGTTTDPSGATGWTKATSPSIANLASINAIAFSPFTQRWLAVGAGATGSLGTNVLTSSDATGTTWTAGAVTSALTPVITLNTCIWNQLPASASAAGRWLAAGTRNGGVGANSACVYISTDTSGAAIPWTPVTGTGAILSQVYSIAYNGQVWIAAGTPAIDNGSTSTLMRTADPTGATGWHGITMTNASTSGFDTAARSITWNADQQMWVATGENTGSTADASFSSVIYSQDINGAAGTWRTVRESNSVCFSGEGTGVAFTGEKWFAVGDNGTGSGSVIVATSGTTAANAGTSWTPVAHGTALTRASDIEYTGRRLVATGTGPGATSGIIYSSNGTGANGTWTSVPSAAAGAFNDISGGATSITMEASYEGTGRIVATGRSATNALSVSTDGGETWTAPSTQYSSTNTFDTTTTPLFTTGGNSVAYVGNDTLFAGGGNDVHWNGKRWVATGRNSAAATATTGAPAPDVVNNNTTPVATSEDGITWQCVRASQAPSLTEGTFIGTNSRIGATPLINSQITITDGGDTESNADYGGMSGGSGGSGTGVAQIDIIAELTPVSNAAASVNGTVGIIGAAGNGGVNGIGHVTIPSFDNTAFTITTRPT